jgi:hypothetical protein
MRAVAALDLAYESHRELRGPGPLLISEASILDTTFQRQRHHARIDVTPWRDRIFGDRVAYHLRVSVDAEGEHYTLPPGLPLADVQTEGLRALERVRCRAKAPPWPPSLLRQTPWYIDRLHTWDPDDVVSAREPGKSGLELVVARDGAGVRVWGSVAGIFAESRVSEVAFLMSRGREGKLVHESLRWVCAELRALGVDVEPRTALDLCEALTLRATRIWR